ncbi:hypothetical protein [Amycolatopsis sp. NPDC059657]|uniref:hypothetical protein n=1 Tax=Amycolatopsis sp. NPDC059657 TaxID=3346899 RepID=UPI00366C34A7
MTSAEQAYAKLYFHLTGDTGTPPALPEPATSVERQDLHATLTWLAMLLDKDDLDTDHDAQEALRRFADHQGWP